MIRLKELREIKKLSQKEVANALNKSFQAYSHYETGKRQPDYDTLKKLAVIFEVSIDYLLGHDDPIEIEKIQFVSRLKQVRENSGLTQKEAASKLNIPYTKYNHYETGRNQPDIETIIQISNFFGITTDYLLGRDKSSTIQNKEKFSPEDMEILRQIKNLPSDKREIIDTVIKISEKATDEQAATSGK